MDIQTKMRKKEKKSTENRSPLQRLNGLQIRKPNCKTSSNLSSSASVSFEVPNDCPRLLLSSNSSSASSSCYYYSSKTHFHRKPNNLLTVTNNTYLKSSAVTLKARSLENEVPKKPFSQKHMKNQPPRLGKKRLGKANTKPTIKNVQRSNLCSAQRNPVKIFKKGSDKIEAKLENSEENDSAEPNDKLFGVYSNINLDCIENLSPDAKITSVCGLDSVSFAYPPNVKQDSISKIANGKNSDNAVKTPPVEASVSPEIQCGTHSKIPIAKSGATPICYGAGHLLWEATDKRKCRRRGSLKGGCEKINLLGDEKNYENVISNSWDSLLPLPVEASVHWILSPCDEGREDTENEFDKYKMIGECGAFVELDLLLSSPSTLCENMSDFGCEKKMHEQENNDVIKNNSALSLGSFSSGNIIHTPSPDSSSYGCLKGSNMDFIQFELDSVTETLDKVGLWPGGISLQCEDMDMSSSIISPTQVQENLNNVCSWVSDSENLALSQTRVSWKDGFVNENYEFDCFRCLSDEVIDGHVCSDKELCPMSGAEKENDLTNYGCLRSSCVGTESGENEEYDMQILSDEPCISTRGNEKLLKHGISASAESISTNGGELVASGDSDFWKNENRLYRVK